MNRLHLKMLAGLSMIVLFTWDCAATADIEKDPSTDITAYRTFTWINKGSKDKQAALLDRQIKVIFTLGNDLFSVAAPGNRNLPGAC